METSLFMPLLTELIGLGERSYYKHGAPTALIGGLTQFSCRILLPQKRSTW